jgi:hypothetical protein
MQYLRILRQIFVITFSSVISRVKVELKSSVSEISSEQPCSECLVRPYAQQYYWTILSSECTISAIVYLDMMELYAAPQKSFSHG